MTKKFSVILIFGAPRSGMSALAGCLKLLGSNPGSSLLEAPAPKSYPLFEHADIISAHDRLFDELGLSWDKLSPLPEDWLETPAANKAEQRLLRILETDFFNTDHWVIKDFRLCRLLPLWLKVLESIDVKTIPVIMLRHPDEAAQSMKNCYNLQPDSAKLLWYFYNQWALRSCGSFNPYFLTYDQVLADPIEALGSLARKSGLTWTHSLRNQTPLLLDFIQPGLKQYFITSSQHEHENSPYIHLYNQLRCQTSAPENLPDLPDLHELHQNLQTHHDSTPPHIWALLNDMLFQMAANLQPKTYNLKLAATHTQDFNASSHNTASTGLPDRNDEIMSLKAQLAQSSQRWEQTAGLLSQMVQTNDELIQKLSARMQDRPAQGEEP